MEFIEKSAKINQKKGKYIFHTRTNSRHFGFQEICKKDCEI